MYSLQLVPPASPWYLVAGVVVILVAVLDILWTTLWVDGGAGPLSARLTTGVWRGLRRFARGRSRLLGLSGPICLVATLAAWFGLMWVGWTLVFAGSPTALLPARDGVPVTWSGRFYFVGYTLFTMGNGDFYPPAGVWQIATSLMTASGMLFVTLGVSYVLSVLGAVSEKRSFASNVSGLGDRSVDIVRRGWDGEGFDGLELPLNSLAGQLDLLAVQHKAYPILHYYHGMEAEHASAMGVAVFDEALLLLRYGVPEEVQPNTALVESARDACENYVDTLDEAYFEPADETPPAPNLDRLRDAAIPTVSDEAYAGALSEQVDRRRELYGLVLADAWYWPPLEDD